MAITTIPPLPPEMGWGQKSRDTVPVRSTRTRIRARIKTKKRIRARIKTKKRIRARIKTKKRIRARIKTKKWIRNREGRYSAELRL